MRGFRGSGRRGDGIAVVIALFGALAFARYDWKGRSAYQKVVLLPIFFPQTVLGLALLLWFNALGFTMSWQTAVFAHLVWIIPVCTLVIAIQVYSFDPALEEAAFDLGATRFQVFREVRCSFAGIQTLDFLATDLFHGGGIAAAECHVVAIVGQQPLAIRALYDMAQLMQKN